MKNIKIGIVLTTLVIFNFSCSKDFLEKNPSEFLTTDQIAEAADKNPAVARGTMTGIYSLTVETRTGGTSGHDDFGHKGYDIFSDMLTGDMALSVSTYGWYRASITEFQGPLDFTYTDNYQVWRYYYRIIRSANLVIGSLGGNDAVPDNDENKYLMGQAKAIRAHSYFYLTQYFSNSYDPSAEILPLYDDLDDLNGPKVATSVIFDLMIKDLTDAIDLLEGFERTAKNEINKAVAQGILAYVYGSMGDKNDQVVALTKDIIDNGGFTIVSADEAVYDGPGDEVGGFNDVSSSGWMWGIDLTQDVNLGLISWWGQIDAFSYSYAWAGDAKAIDAGLYDAIPEDDVRKKQFNNSPGSYYHLMPINKFYDPNRVIGGQTTITTDYVYMRVAEMYLLNAEASARMGGAGEDNARTMLKELLVNRIQDASYVDALSGQNLLDEIYLQTRIELWGEGKSYLAMKRNKATITRGSNHLSFVGVPINYDDERLTFEIPEAEIQDNPYINSQN